VLAKEILVVIRAGKDDCLGQNTGSLWMSEHLIEEFDEMCMILGGERKFYNK